MPSDRTITCPCSGGWHCVAAVATAGCRFRRGTHWSRPSRESPSSCWWAFIVLDRQALPTRFVALVVCSGFAVPALWPEVHPVSWSPPISLWLTEYSWLVRFDTSLVGLLAGGSLGWLLVNVHIPSNRDLTTRHEQRTGTIVAFATVGLYLGWQAAIFLLVLACLARLLVRSAVSGWKLGAVSASTSASTEVGTWDSLLIWLFPATVLQICLWRSIDRCLW